VEDSVHPTSGTRAARADAYIDETGRHVRCAWQWRDGTVCGEQLVIVAVVTDPWGGEHRLLRFPHHAWIQKGVVWHEAPGTKGRHQRGFPARSRALPHEVDGSAVDPDERTLYVPPRAVLRCPNTRCRNKRLVDAEALGVESDEHYSAWLRLAQLVASASAEEIALVRDYLAARGVVPDTP
jgi:hypothetical protein